MVTTSPDWLIPGIDGGKKEDPRPYPPVQSPRGEAEPLARGAPLVRRTSLPGRGGAPPPSGVVRLGVLGGIRGLEEEEREQERPWAREHVRFGRRELHREKKKK